jgi:CBS domain containing-hemolysin-like protein
MIALYTIIIFVMLVLSACFSGTEAAFNSANNMHLRREAEENGSSSAKLAYKICQNFANALCTILIGNNLVNIAASSCATAIFMQLFAHISGGDAIASVVSTVVLTIIVLIFGEIVPKILAKQHANKICKITAWPIQILTYILYPLVFIVMLLMNLIRKIWGKESEDEPEITEDELSSIIDTVEKEGVIDEDQSDLLQSSLEFSDTTVEEIMTPRTDLVTIDLDDDFEKIAKTIEESTFSRLPVYRDSIDEIIGILHLNLYYKEAVDSKKIDIESMLLDTCYMHKTLKLPAALKMLREKQVHMAIVIDEFGGTLGVVTIEDILEEIVGDIWDESDVIISEMIEKEPNVYEILGEMSIGDLFYELDFHPKDFECEYSTVGGWAIQSLEAEPHVGDKFTYEFLEIEVTEMEDDILVTKLKVTVGERPTDEDEESDE